MVEWDRIAPVLDAVLDLSDEERETQLISLCDGDRNLEAEVRKLLNAADDTDWYLQDAAQDALQLALENHPEQDLTGTIIGNYTLERLIGRGGMGAVYLGRRSDGAFEQTTAIKVLPGSTHSPFAIERFNQERQILARLQHEHIAQLFDGGVSEAGMPYFVMEYVEGQAIHNYCEAENLDQRACIELFDRVCAAVTYAHTNLIIHRDIKPDNVIVSASGVPKLLDFGISTVLEQSESSAVVSHALTPNFAAPEQILKGESTTLSDLYSLGVLLHKLLSHKLPFTHQNSDFDSLRKEVEQRVVTPACSDAELNAIVSKALQADPADRYDSVSALRVDLERWRNQLPVAAYPQSRRYRLRKFTIRNWLPVGATTLIMVAILAGTFTTYSQAQETAHQAARAHRVANFLQGLFDAANPFGAWKTEKSLQDILDFASARFERELADDPQVLAEMQNVLGVAHIGNGQYERARDLLQEALSVSEATHGASSIEVAKAANNLSWAFIELGDHESAIPNAERALTIYTKILGRESVEAADAMTNLAAAKSTAGDKAGAQILHTEALSIRKQRLASGNPSIADSMMSLATVNSALGNFASVVELNQGAHTIYSQAYGRDHPMSVRAMNGVASGQFLTKQYAQAEIAFRELLDLSTRRLGDAHPELALYYNNLGRVLTELGKFHEAREHLQAGMDIVANGHPQRMLAISTQYNYATILMELGELTEASPRLLEATSQFIAVLGDKHPLIARSEVQLARLAWLMGDIQESEIAFKNSITALENPGMSSAWLAEAKFELAKLYIQRGQASRAATLITSAKPVFESAYPEDSWRWAEFRAIAAVIASDTPLRTHSIEQLDLLLPDEAVRLQFIENLDF